MIYFPSTKANISTEFAIASGATVDAEGMALVADTADGTLGVKPSTGAAGDVFVGVAVSQQMTLTRLTKAEQFVQGATDKVTLAFAPSAGTVSVYDDTSGTVIAAGAGGWTLAGKDVSLQAGTRGHTVTVHYAFVPNANQARAVQGDIVPGGPAGNAITQCGVIRNGIVYTDQYDTTVDWTSPNPVVKLAANGRFTIGGAGATLGSVSVLQAPTAGFPYLGLLIN